MKKIMHKSLMLLAVTSCLLLTNAFGKPQPYESLASLTLYPWEPECRRDLPASYWNSIAYRQLFLIAPDLQSIYSERMLKTIYNLSLSTISQIQLDIILKLAEEQKNEIINQRINDLGHQFADEYHNVAFGQNTKNTYREYSQAEINKDAVEKLQEKYIKDFTIVLNKLTNNKDDLNDFLVTFYKTIGYKDANFLDCTAPLADAPSFIAPYTEPNLQAAALHEEADSDIYCFKIQRRQWK